MRAYFESEAQPDHRMDYTARLDMARRNGRPRFKSVREKGSGRGIQIVLARRRASRGVTMKGRGEAVDRRTGSLLKSSTLSATG